LYLCSHKYNGLHRSIIIIIIIIMHTIALYIVQSLSNVKYIATKRLKRQSFGVGLRLTINGAVGSNFYIMAIRPWIAVRPYRDATKPG